MIKLSFRDVEAYIGQSPHVPNGIPYTSNPSAPWASQEMNAYKGHPQGTYFCPNQGCVEVKLLVNDGEHDGICTKCQGRFSILERQVGNDFTSRALPRGTGLLNTDQGSNSVPAAHSTNEYGGGSASKSWGS
jgi:hypothetical protein